MAELCDKTINVLFAGIGGQGIIRASDMLTEAAFRMGYDVKKSELHGMSQRGGSVSSDVRFGKKVLSPMIPEKSANDWHKRMTELLYCIKRMPVFLWQGTRVSPMHGESISCLWMQMIQCLYPQWSCW